MSTDPSDVHVHVPMSMSTDPSELGAHAEAEDICAPGPCMFYMYESFGPVLGYFSRLVLGDSMHKTWSGGSPYYGPLFLVVGPCLRGRGALWRFQITAFLVSAESNKRSNWLLKNCVIVRLPAGAAFYDKGAVPRVSVENRFSLFAGTVKKRRLNQAVGSVGP